MTTRNTSGMSLGLIIPYPTGRFFRGVLFQALRARLRSHRPSGTNPQTALSSAIHH